MHAYINKARAGGAAPSPGDVPCCGSVRMLLTTFTLCSHTELCCTVLLRYNSSSRGQVFHNVTSINIFACSNPKFLCP